MQCRLNNTHIKYKYLKKKKIYIYIYLKAQNIEKKLKETHQLIPTTNKAICVDDPIETPNVMSCGEIQITITY